MGNVLYSDKWDKHPKPVSSAGMNILAGQLTGQLCPHCGAERVTALAMPHAVKGTACIPCNIFFHGLEL